MGAVLHTWLLSNCRACDVCTRGLQMASCVFASSPIVIVSYSTTRTDSSQAEYLPLLNLRTQHLLRLHPCTLAVQGAGSEPDFALHPDCADCGIRCIRFQGPLHMDQKLGRLSLLLPPRRLGWGTLWDRAKWAKLGTAVALCSANKNEIERAHEQVWIMWIVWAPENRSARSAQRAQLLQQQRRWQTLQESKNLNLEFTPVLLVVPAK